MRSPTLFQTFSRAVAESVLLASFAAAAGAQQVQNLRDINPGAASSTPREFADLAGVLYFAAQDGAHGLELWKTDGTTAGTALAADLRPGTAGSNPLSLSVVGDVLYFSANLDPNFGSELYASDGTLAGTRLVADIVPGSAGSGPGMLRAHGGKLFFRASLGPTTSATFVTDGTAAGTVQLGPPAYSGYWPAGPVVYYSNGSTASGYELWATDGTPAGTRMVKDIWPGAGSSSPAGFFVLGDRMLFTASDGQSGSEPWISDGSAAGTQMLRDINPGSAPSNAGDYVAFRGYVWFLADDGQHGYELWRTDGTAAGTVFGFELMPGAQSSGNPGVGFGIGVVNDSMVLMANGASGAGLYRTDGTLAGTTRISPTAPDVGGFVAVGQRKLIYTGDRLNAEPWITDGTAAGTHQLAELQAGAGSYPTGFTLFRGRVLFAANGPLGNEPFVLDPGATSQRIGRGCGFGTREPQLVASDPVLGQPLSLDCSQGYPGAIGAAVIGAPDLRSSSVLGCSVWIDLRLYVTLPAILVPPHGVLTQGLTVPVTPSLSGRGLVGQVVFANTPGFFESTNGTLLTFGQ